MHPLGKTEPFDVLVKRFICLCGSSADHVIVGDPGGIIATAMTPDPTGRLADYQCIEMFPDLLCVSIIDLGIDTW